MRSSIRPLLVLALTFLSSPVRGTIGVDLQLQLGNPSSATADETNPRSYLIKRPQYALDYNNTTREPNWVSWHLTLADIGASGRGDFAVDPTLPAGFARVQITDYSGSGYDRGHVCPSGDRTATVADNQVTFYMSNMVPQSPDNNQGVWASFETYCRSLASLGNEVLLVSGPGGFAGPTLASGVAIPGYVWKIALVVPAGPGSALSRINSATRVIALKVPNIAGIRSNPWQQYLTSVAQLETETGYTFLTELPAAVATALRAKVDEQSGAGAPRIATQPSAQSVALGGTATFTVSATGNAPLTYQWSLDGAEISGATAATLSVTGTQVSHVGLYSVVVANSLGSVTSAAAALSLGQAADTGIITWDFTAATPTSGLPPGITGGVITQGGNNGTTQMLTSVSVASGYSGVSGGNNAGAAARVGPLTRTAGAGSAFFEFTLSPAPGRQLVVSSLSFGMRSTATGPQAFALFTSIDDFTAPVTAGPLANNSVWTLLTPAFPAFAGVPGTAITFRLYGYNGTGNAATGTANWRLDDLRLGVTAVANSATPPVITRQPGPATVVAGGTATLSVTATAAPAPEYQWLKDGVALPGATGSTLVLPNVAPAQAGGYAVVLRNSAATVTSAVAGLAVIRRSFGGYYFGRLIRPGSEGAFALEVRPDNTGTWLGFLPSPATAWLARTVTVADDGAFRFAASALGQAPPAGEIAGTGQFDEHGRLTAAGTAGLTLTGDRTVATATTAPLAGFYTAGAPARAAMLYALVGDSGQCLVVTASGAEVDAGGPGVLDAAGTASLVTLGQRRLNLAVSAATSILAATIVRPEPSAAPETYAGLRANSPASFAQRLVNLSTRTAVGSGDQVAIAGFVVTGLESKPILLRAAGPALRTFGVTSALSAPRLELLRGSTLLAANAGWDSAPHAADIAASVSRAGAFPFPASSTDSAILITLAPGAYTAVASAADGRTGVGLVEIYDLAAEVSAQRLANLSTRAAAGGGDNTLLLGLVVSGTVPKRVLLRAAGPALGAFGVIGFLARPELTLVADGKVIATNSGWNLSADSPAIAEAAAQSGAFAFSTASLDAALVINLAPGAYTAQVTGVAGAAGLVLLEAYEVP